jgi:hypothetical protein
LLEFGPPALDAGGFFLGRKLLKSPGLRTQQGLRRIFHTRQLGRFSERQMKLRHRRGLNNAMSAFWTVDGRAVAPNPVTGLWSCCTRLHSKQIHPRVFR